jgi:hypothetical protein
LPPSASHLTVVARESGDPGFSERAIMHATADHKHRGYRMLCAQHDRAELGER